MRDVQSLYIIIDIITDLSILLSLTVINYSSNK